MYRDPSFRYIINYCVENGSYQNVPLKHVQEWHEPSPAPPTPAPPSSKSSPSSSPSSNGTPNGTAPNGTPNGTLGGWAKAVTNGQVDESSKIPPKPLPNTAKLPAKHHPQTAPSESSTNQDNEDVFVAASRKLAQHNAEPASSKAASVAKPAHAEVQIQHKDAVLMVLARFFDPAHPASGRDPAALAPLFAQGDVAGYCDELVHNIVTAGTQVGRDESLRACGVLKVLGDYVATLPEVLTKMYLSYTSFSLPLSLFLRST